MTESAMSHPGRVPNETQGEASVMDRQPATAPQAPASAPSASNLALQAPKPPPKPRNLPPVKPPLPGEAPPLLLDVHAAARALGVPKKTVGNWNRSGRLPMPIRMGSRSLLWRADELAAWVRNGCPSRLRWETMKGARR